MAPLIDLMGRRFGSLLVVSRAQNDKSKRAWWVCICDCGSSKTTSSKCLVLAETTSCGCTRGKHSITHGMTDSPEHKVWSNMHSRCRNPKATQFKDYGGRGIRVCERWQRFENFYADMGGRPSPAHTIDRENNDGNYEPGNCRWVTRKKQNLNRRSNIDLVGQVFGRLTVLERAHGIHWKCLCECGNTKLVTSCNLRGTTSSCGCRKSEVSRDTLRARRAQNAV